MCNIAHNEIVTYQVTAQRKHIEHDGIVNCQVIAQGNYMHLTGSGLKQVPCSYAP